MKKLPLYSLLAVGIVITVIALVTTSCSNFDKIVKSSDYHRKDTMAAYYYNKENYMNALTLYEALIPVFNGTQRAEESYYYYAYCNYHMGDYGLAAYHFKMYVRNFPKSNHAEECAFMNAYCYYLNSPKYSLDQEDTKTAVFE